MDMTETIAPKSDQINADDLMTGPVTVTVSEVIIKGGTEQPVDVHLVEFPGRAYRPSKSMRRIMVAAWGPKTSAYAGRRLTLYRNPEITFGRDKVGGIEISHLSHLDKPLTVALTATRGKRKGFTVQPLAEAAPRDWGLEIDSRTGNVDALKALWSEAQQAGQSPELLERIRAAATTEAVA
ncbi:hypothetical protein D6T65_05110 [Arthrobacter frigidicola]|nr:hypothetical protein D6T65_05110 [Arthrobacter frigidicola]